VRGNIGIPSINVRESCNVTEVEPAPDSGTCMASEKGMVPVLNIAGAVLTQVIIQHMLGMEVGSCD
jgi:hypothetical protein